jgi:hypothetical protein
MFAFITDIAITDDYFLSLHFDVIDTLSPSHIILSFQDISIRLAIDNGLIAFSSHFRLASLLNKTLVINTSRYFLRHFH